jgi:hypothetical protein
MRTSYRSPGPAFGQICGIRDSWQEMSGDGRNRLRHSQI